MIRIAVDAMGGDYAPHNIIEGAVEAMRSAPGEREIIFVGDSQLIKNDLSRHDTTPLVLFAVISCLLS